MHSLHYGFAAIAALLLLPVSLLAVAVVLKTYVARRPVPWYEDEQAEEMRQLGIDPDERWHTNHS